mmetsp:Transcript_5990/g.5152  ORF Transcript_5990/g.5152 Transcript_5990/m.5152 type:complete len:172 (+) Transcript_5990:67-582(+)
MNHQLRYYNKLFDKYIDFISINAPHECKEVFDMTIAEMFKPPFYSWYFYNSESQECDGILGFSQGTIMARILLKLNEFKSELPQVEVDLPKFGIMFSGIFTERAKYFPEYPKDAFKIMTSYEQPMMYVYGERDPLKSRIEDALVKEGDYTIVKHNYAHNIPKFRGEELEDF